MNASESDSNKKSYPKISSSDPGWHRIIYFFFDCFFSSYPSKEKFQGKEKIWSKEFNEIFISLMFQKIDSTRNEDLDIKKWIYENASTNMIDDEWGIVLVGFSIKKYSLNREIKKSKYDKWDISENSWYHYLIRNLHIFRIIKYIDSGDKSKNQK